MENTEANDLAIFLIISNMSKNTPRQNAETLKAWIIQLFNHKNR